jgi:geranylgeranyl diphosphate synthase type II
MLASQNISTGHPTDISEVDSLMAVLLSGHSGSACAAALEHLSSPGKQVRARLALHSARSLGLDLRSAVAIAAASELIHNASLVHDDIQDGSDLRRGISTLWARHGRDVAICAGDLMISAAYAALAQVGGPHVPHAVARMHARISQVIHGQVSDLAARDSSATTFFQYRTIAVDKSAPLLGLPVELSLILAGRLDCLVQAERAADAFALAYQMADDLEDVESDMANGSLNAVAIFAREMPMDRARLLVRRLVNRTFRQASRLAGSLPSDSGALMAAMADQRAWAVEGRPFRP